MKCFLEDFPDELEDECLCSPVIGRNYFSHIYEERCREIMVNGQNIVHIEFIPDPEKEDLKILVLAGNIEQFKNRVRGEDEHKYVYAKDIESIRGLRVKSIEIYGTFWDREDAGELFEYAKTALR